jgi:hypothetical protein
VKPLLGVPDAKKHKERITKGKERSGLKCLKELKKNALIVLICIRNPLHGVPHVNINKERITKEKERRNLMFRMDINTAHNVDILNI